MNIVGLLPVLHCMLSNMFLCLSHALWLVMQFFILAAAQIAYLRPITNEFELEVKI